MSGWTWLRWTLGLHTSVSKGTFVKRTGGGICKTKDFDAQVSGFFFFFLALLVLMSIISCVQFLSKISLNPVMCWKHTPFGTFKLNCNGLVHNGLKKAAAALQGSFS